MVPSYEVPSYEVPNYEVPNYEVPNYEGQLLRMPIEPLVQVRCCVGG